MTYAHENGVTQNRQTNGREYVSLVEKIRSKEEKGEPFFSLEFFPPRTRDAAINLFAQFDRMRVGGPLFCDVTWHAKSNPADLQDTADGIDSVNIAGIALNYCGLDTLLHLTCISQTQESLKLLLQRVMKRGIRNLLILRGDIEAKDSGRRDFEQAIDMIRFVREHYGQYFTIAVSGYPNGHPESRSYVDDLFYLKAKVKAGADFVITQLFFEAETFIRFKRDCRQIGIEVPILPGIMPIQSYESLRHILRLSQLPVPEKIAATVEQMRNNDADIRKYGIKLTVEICTALFEANATTGVHFYTLNREIAVVEILKQLNLWKKSPQKSLPWRTAPNHKRQSEDVRPIFWSSRVKSYLYRTQAWDEFPNGRWGRSSSPAFGELKDYYLFIGKSRFTAEKKRQMWGTEIREERDVWHVFHCYLTRSANPCTGSQVLITPWNEDDLRSETSVIAQDLAYLNLRGVLTINSQPNINGVRSDDPIHGWGEKNGYVYQKVSSSESRVSLKSVCVYRRIWSSSHLRLMRGS